MEHAETDPYNVAVSDLNERKQNVALGSIKDSIAENGVYEAPLVRRRNGATDSDGPEYEVFVGQRRVMAAQQVDLDTIPVRVADWDDFNAIKASITENVDEFQSHVHPDDRALALKRMAESSADPTALKDNGFPRPSWIGEEIGVDNQKAREWLEPIHPRWEDTPLHAEHVVEKTAGDQQSEKEQVESSEVGATSLYQVRNATSNPEDAELLAEKVAQGEFSQRDVRQVKQQQSRGKSFSEAVENVGEAKEGRSITRTVRFDGRVADAIDRCGKEDGTSDQEVIRHATEAYLEERGYL